MKLRLTLPAVLTALLLTTQVSARLVYSDQIDLQFRFDERSNRDQRSQYRLRYYPQLALANANWSVNSFVATGDDFGSSHNTRGSSHPDHIYMRRLFVRHSNRYGKTEVGVIPTYKGRVSSSGLSKDGWIEGIRHVRLLRNDSALELVIGQLDSTDAANALALPEDLDYLELEYSAQMEQAQSFEVSIERMTGGNFLRGEYRWKHDVTYTLFIEIVKRLDENETKTVGGISGSWQFNSTALNYFAHYSYVSQGFGPRAELTEDFLGTGHGFSGEIEGALSSQWGLDWFVRLDVVDSVSRVLGGIKVSFSHP